MTAKPKPPMFDDLLECGNTIPLDAVQWNWMKKVWGPVDEEMKLTTYCCGAHPYIAARKKAKAKP